MIMLNNVLTNGKVCLIFCGFGLFFGNILHWQAGNFIAKVCGVLLIFAGLSIIRFQTPKIRLKIDNDHVIVGEKVFCKLIATNNLPVSTSTITAKLQITGSNTLGNTSIDVTIPRIPSHTVHTSVVELPFNNRALYKINSVQLIKSDIFGLFNRVRQVEHQSKVFVHPKVHALNALKQNNLKDIDGTATNQKDIEGWSLSGMREYQFGDDYKQIHHKYSAKYDKLIIREYEQNCRSQVACLLSLNTADYLADYDTDNASVDATDQRTIADFELSLSALCSLVYRILRTNREVTVYTYVGDISNLQKVFQASSVRSFSRFLENVTLLQVSDAVSNSGGAGTHTKQYTQETGRGTVKNVKAQSISSITQLFLFNGRNLQKNTLKELCFSLNKVCNAPSLSIISSDYEQASMISHSRNSYKYQDLTLLTLGYPQDVKLISRK